MSEVALLIIALFLGFLKYFIGFKFLIHIIVSAVGILIVPMNYPFNPFIIPIAEYQFFELVVNGLIYLLASIFVNLVIE